MQLIKWTSTIVYFFGRQLFLCHALSTGKKKEKKKRFKTNMLLHVTHIYKSLHMKIKEEKKEEDII